MTTTMTRRAQRRFGAVTFVRTLERATPQEFRTNFLRALRRYASACLDHKHNCCDCRSCMSANSMLAQAALNMREFCPILDQRALVTINQHAAAILEILEQRPETMERPSGGKVAA